ncbi:hypothetical protein [Halorubrum ezzemoulense]|uniref:Uncharacterized protein n=1 Tax=Halorubrum ezzemoulense TaxID=337243 RepID=A0A256JF31_HALEZ|nr:hypothetical protein [Halorubrum ezzemoulense]OYR67233.1 hypothetical protein DJ78_16325 [Halorubrum ezzemoulense]
MSEQQLSRDIPSSLVRNYAEEVVETYLETVADDSVRTTEIEELYHDGNVIEAAARTVTSNNTE